ncbi:MAG: hypothetical protein LBP65_01120 [Puniceicoccales bacterium]|jgi:hypothetical protein|nr:hypothetical protein [Puniceicoccales bacterium]
MSRSVGAQRLLERSIVVPHGGVYRGVIPCSEADFSAVVNGRVPLPSRACIQLGGAHNPLVRSMRQTFFQS